MQLSFTHCRSEGKRILKYNSIYSMKIWKITVWAVLWRLILKILFKHITFQTLIFSTFIKPCECISCFQICISYCLWKIVCFHIKVDIDLKNQFVYRCLSQSWITVNYIIILSHDIALSLPWLCKCTPCWLKSEILRICHWQSELLSAFDLLGLIGREDTV